MCVSVIVIESNVEKHSGMTVVQNFHFVMTYIISPHFYVLFGCFNLYDL